MLRLSVRFVRPGEIENLKSWFDQLRTVRRDEALATLIDETVHHETAILIEGDPHNLVYAMEVEDPVQSKASASSGKHPIDAEHRTVMQSALGDSPSHQVLLDLMVNR